MMSTPTSPRVTAVIVAYNRSALLSEALDALATQDVALQRVLVVDNASTDETALVVSRYRAPVEYVRLDRNTGGAGGFAAGIALALADEQVDWLWLMDDDTVPTSAALGELLSAVEGRGYAAAGSRVVWTDGSEHPMNTPRRKVFARRAERMAATASDGVPIRSTSFVSMLVAAPIARRVGLPVADYFIWNDDFEYSTRVIRGRRGLHVPQSVVVHKTRALAGTDDDPGARFYYEVRNKLWMFLYSRSLNPAEKVLYGASTLRRWWKTFRRSSDRALLRDGLVRGFRDAAHRPRDNAAVFAGIDAVAAVIPSGSVTDA